MLSMFIQHFTPNMEISRSVIEGKWDNTFIETAQKIAIYTVIPMAIIVFVEAVLKNMIFINLANAAITLVNAGQNLYTTLLGQALDYFGY